MKYITPGGKSPKIYSDLTTENHILIAGATGSGKSTLINSFIARLLMSNSPATAQFIFIDTKRIELYQYRKLPHTINYSDTPEKAINALNYAIKTMECRYNRMQKNGQKTTTEAHIYIFIDEYADLITTHKKQIEQLTTKIIQLGRAAGIHLIIGTQRPCREVITGTIKVNLDCKIALRTASAQDSRNIIGINGAECLPRFGCGIISNCEGIKHYELPMLRPDALIKYWNSKQCIYSRF